MERHDPGGEHFDRLVAELPRLLDRLLEAPAAKVAAQQPIPKEPGIYLFSELDQPIYVGQTRNLHLDVHPRFQWPRGISGDSHSEMPGRRARGGVFISGGRTDRRRSG
jgi:hypothetical protein